MDGDRLARAATEGATAEAPHAPGFAAAPVGFAAAPGEAAGRESRGARHQFRIGRLRFGLVGLVAGIVGLAALLSGGAVALVMVTDQAESSGLDALVGRWERPGEQPLSGVEVSPTILIVSPDGQFTFSAGVRMNVPGWGEPFDDFPDLGRIRIDCGGEVEPAESRFTFRTTSGPCDTLEARLSADGNMLRISSSDGSADRLTTLTKVAP